MSKRPDESKPNGYTKTCRDCDNTIYLHRGPTGPWRAYDLPAETVVGEEVEYVRHRCPAALQDAEIMHIISPAGTKPGDLAPKLKRLITDFQTVVEQAEARNAPVTPAATAQE